MTLDLASRTRVLSAAAASVVGALSTPGALASVPEVLHYQGHLANAAGEPVDCPEAATCPGFPFSLTFRLYAAPEGGDALWTEAHPSVPISNGIFHLLLGATVPLAPSLLDSDVWLGVSVGAGKEMSPRQRLVSVPYALRAAESDWSLACADASTLEGLPAASFVQSADLPGLCVTDEELAAILAEQGYLTEAALGLYLTEQGYIAGPPFSGDWEDLENVPPVLEHLSLDEAGNLTFQGTPIVDAGGAWIGAGQLPGANPYGSKTLHGLFEVKNEAEMFELSGVEEIVGDLKVRADYLPTVSFPKLRTVSGNLEIRPDGGTTDYVKSLSLPELESVGSNLIVSGLASVSEIVFPKLTQVGTLTVSGNTQCLALPCDTVLCSGQYAGMTHLSAPMLEIVQGKVSVAYNKAVLDLSLPALESVGAIDIYADMDVLYNCQLESIDVWSLKTVARYLSVYGNPNLPECLVDELEDQIDFGPFCDSNPPCKKTSGNLLGCTCADTNGDGKPEAFCN